MTQTTALRARIADFVAISRAHRAARADRAQLVSALSTYTTESDRAEMDAILARYPESETHRAWDEVSASAVDERPLALAL